MKKQVLTAVCLGIAACWFGIAAAGTLTNSDDPTTTGSGMPTIEEVYEYLINGTEETTNSSFQEPTAVPGSTMKTTKEIYNKIEAERASDLKPENIRCGVEIFGVTGALSAECVAKTGHTTCYDASGTTTDCAGTGQDGEYQKGCDPTVAPSYGTGFGGYNRASFTCQEAGFTNNENGTVTDNLTGLIWLKKADCFGTKNWSDALTAANELTAGTCGLTDGSSAGDWRLPNINELRSLFDPGRSSTGDKYLPEGHPFDGVRTSSYWSSTSYVDWSYDPTRAWSVNLYYGSGVVYAGGKANPTAVWPVRGGQ